MLTAFLAGSGARVLIPDAAALVPGETDDKVHFVDDQGRVLVIFNRADVITYSGDGQHLSLAAEVHSRSRRD
jgi:hypothetical protein